MQDNYEFTNFAKPLTA